jgi:hypothetical protein
MKNLFILVFSVILVIAYHQNNSLVNKTKDKEIGRKTKNESFESIKNTNSISIKDSTFKIVIKDSSDYSLSFLKSLTKPGERYWQYTLSGNLFIINSKDTCKFPSVPPLGKTVVLKNKVQNEEVNLTVTRLNQSTIEYLIELIENNNAPIIKKGIADLYPVFYFGSEEDLDNLSGKYYDSYEYWDINDNFHTSIRIGKEPEKKESLRAKIICNIGSIKIDLKNFPALIERK